MKVYIQEKVQYQVRFVYKLASYQNKQISSTQVSDENERDGDGQAEADSHPEKVGPAKSQTYTIISKDRQEDDCQKDKLWMKI